MNLQNFVLLIRKRIARLRSYIISCKYFLYDYKKMFNNSIEGGTTQDNFNTRILLTSHQLEKGLSHTKSVRVFGEQKAVYLKSLLTEYLSLYGKTDVYKLGVNVLDNYIACNNSTKNIKIKEDIKKFIESNKEVIGHFKTGVKIVSEPRQFNISEIQYFFNSRSSVREFSQEPISDETILNVMEFAKCTPTACNRQTSRVHIFRDKKLMGELIKNQLGDQGWCNNATAIFVITSNLNYFNSTFEHMQAYIDGGLYAMNFDWGLHLYHIASCYKMYVRQPSIDKEFHEISKIPLNETPIVLILAGHYPNHSVVSPKSVRLPIESSNLFVIHS